jgi:glycosyltransferase involved in cell wall biosynthesis
MSEPRAPTVSVIVPAYNAGRYVGAALDAALDQTLPPHEVIVVDDGSTDDTAARCAPYGDRVRYVRQPNQGEAGARNTALALATGDYVALLDADDVCAPDRFEKQAAVLEARPDAVVCYSGHWVFSDAGRGPSYPGNPAAGERGTADFLCRLLAHPITMTFRRKAAGGLRFPVGVMTGGDMIFTAHLRHRGPAVILPDVLYGYRRHPAQVTARFTEMDSFRLRLEWARKHGAEAWPGLGFADVERAMWRSAADALGMHYWARRRREFLALREDLRREWPAHLERPAELGLRWYPDWLWKCRDRLGDLLRGRAATPLTNGDGARPAAAAPAGTTR